MIPGTGDGQGVSAPGSEAAASPPAPGRTGGVGAAIDLKGFAEIAGDLETAFSLVGRDPRGARQAARDVVRTIELSPVDPDLAHVVNVLWRAASTLEAGAAKLARGLCERRPTLATAGERMIARAAELAVDLGAALEAALKEPAGT